MALTKTFYDANTGVKTQSDLSSEELNEITAYENKSAERKLEQIREIRNQKLKDTDYLGLSDNSMSSDWIAKRKSWRDIPENYVDETAYDLLLVRNEDGKLTHTIWENA